MNRQGFVGISFFWISCFFLLASACEAKQSVAIPDVLKNKRFTADYSECMVKSEAPFCAPSGLRKIASVQIDFQNDNIAASFGDPSSNSNIFLPIVGSFTNFKDIVNGKAPKLLDSTENVRVDDYSIDSKKKNATVFTYMISFDLTFYYKKIEFKEKLTWSFDYDLTGGNLNAIRVYLGRKASVEVVPDMILFDQYPSDANISEISSFDGSGFYQVLVTSI